MLHLYCSALTGTTGSTTLDGCSASLWIVSTPASCCSSVGTGGTPCGRSLAPTATRNEWPLAIIALVWKISTGTITRLPLPTACTESCVYGCQGWIRSEEHTSELQSLMRLSYDVFCLNKKKHQK